MSRRRSLRRQQLDLPPPRTNISHLFPEILALIFSFLDVPDKGVAAQVCVAWRDAVYQKSVWKGTQAKIHLVHPYPSLLPSLVKRGIRDIQVLSKTSTNLLHLVRVMPNLDSLNLRFCDISDLEFKSIADLPLTKLDLSFSEGINDYSLGIIAEYLTKLEVLMLGGCDKITNTGLLCIALSLKILKRLDLNSCNISDIGIAHLTGESREAADGGTLRLEYLGLEDCQLVSDNGLGSIATGLKDLRSIDLSFCSNVGNLGLIYISRMPNLRELNLSGCNGINDAGLAYLALGGSKLFSLNVSHCEGVSDVGLHGLSEGLITLRSLNISGCNISDEGVCQLAKTIQELEELVISHCPGVTDKGLMMIAKNLKHLHYIDLHSCPGVTTAGLDAIKKLPNLTLCITCCDTR